MKIMYPARLSLDTKCPNCGSKIINIGGTLYSCQSGHVIECVVMVTLNKAQQAVPAPVEEKLPPQQRFQQSSAVQTDEPILPPKMGKPQ